MSRLPLAVVIVLLIAACSSTSSASDGGASGPVSSAADTTSAPSSALASPSAAPTGPGSITGVVSVNDEPRAGEEVELLPEVYVEPSPAVPPSSDAPSGPTATTDASGRFTFGDLEPGRYALMVTVLVEGAVSSDLFGMSWDEPCAVDQFQVLNVAVADDATGESMGVMANASNQITDTNADQVVTITVGPGTQVTVDIPYVCTIGD